MNKTHLTDLHTNTVIVGPKTEVSPINQTLNNNQKKPLRLANIP